MTGQTFIDIVQQQARARPTALAYRCGDRRWTFADVERDTNRIANTLAALGLGRGDRVAALTKFHVEAALLTLAAAKLGAVCMPVNWRLAPAEVRYIVDHGGAKLMMADRGFLPLVDRAGMPTLQQVVVTDGEDVGTHDGLPGFHDWYAAASDVMTPVSVKPEDPMLQLYSSGTTGLPKGVQLMHRNLLAHLAFIDAGAFGHWVPDDLQLICLPLFHVGGTDSLLWSFYTGSQVLLLRDAAAQTIVDAFRAHRVTIAGFVPTIMAMVLDHPDTAGLDFSALRLVSYGGSPISPELLQQAYATFGCRFQQLFGMTEATGGVVMLADEDHRGDPALLKACGRPLPTTQLKVVDSDGHALQAGEVGEIAVRSPTMMKGYWQRPEETAKAFRDGWYLTGDAGNFDAQGYLYIRDRIKDMVVSGGENIYPTEVEIALRRHPDVAEVAVIGVPDPKWGEAVKAVVVRQPGSALDDVGLIAFARTYLAGFKCPKSVDFVAELPKNAAGKVLRRELRKQYWSGNERQVG